MLLPPSNTSEVLILYLLCQEAGRKYGSKKTFANIESYIYLKMSDESYLAHLCSNKMFLNDGNLIERQAFLMLVCREKKSVLQTLKIVIEQKTAGQFVIKEFIVVVILHMLLKDWFHVFDLCHSPKSNPNFILFLLKVE